MQSWITRARHMLLQQGKWLKVENHEVGLPNGQVIPDWAWVITPDFVNVAALTAEGKFLCFRQVKYAVDGPTLAPCGGYLEPGEDPLAGAQRELREETGYEADSWTAFGKFAIDGNRGCGNGHLFLAHSARKVSAIDRDDLEEMHMLMLTQDEVRAALLRGDFKVATWSQTMALALLALETRP